MITIQHFPKTLKLGQTYQIRRDQSKAYYIILHTTNGNKGSTFYNEVKFLRTSKTVAAHYIISKDGQIVQIVDPVYACWHAGNVSNIAYSNDRTIGIEMHYTPGENKYLPNMYRACKELVEYLINRENILGTALHRHVAIPAGRKIDPSCWTDNEYDAWRLNVVRLRQTRIIRRGATLWTAPDINYPIAEHITENGIVRGNFTRNIEYKISVHSPRWIHIENGIGFVETKYVL